MWTMIKFLPVTFWKIDVVSNVENDVFGSFSLSCRNPYLCPTNFHCMARSPWMRCLSPLQTWTGTWDPWKVRLDVVVFLGFVVALGKG
jgi:hypothetical protein